MRSALSSMRGMQHHQRDPKSCLSVKNDAPFLNLRVRFLRHVFWWDLKSGPGLEPLRFRGARVIGPFWMWRRSRKWLNKILLAISTCLNQTGASSSKILSRQAGGGREGGLAKFREELSPVCLREGKVSSLNLILGYLSSVDNVVLL